MELVGHRLWDEWPITVCQGGCVASMLAISLVTVFYELATVRRGEDGWAGLHVVAVGYTGRHDGLLCCSAAS